VNCGRKLWHGAKVCPRTECGDKLPPQQLPQAHLLLPLPLPQAAVAGATYAFAMLQTIALRAHPGLLVNQGLTDCPVMPDRKDKMVCLGSFFRCRRIWPTNAEFVLRAQRDRPGHLVRLAQLGQKVALDCLELPESQQIWVRLAQRVRLDPLEPMALQDPKVHPAKTAVPVKKDPSGMREQMEPQDPKVHLAQEENQATKVPTVELAHRDQLDHLGLMEMEGNRDHPARLVHLAQMPNIALALRAQVARRKKYNLNNDLVQKTVMGVRRASKLFLLCMLFGGNSKNINL